MTSRARSAVIAVLIVVAGLLTFPAPAAAAGDRCLISPTHPNPNFCTGQFQFINAVASDTFKPFQGVTGTGAQPDIAVSFSQPVQRVRVTANDPDFAGTRAMLHPVGGFFLVPLDATVDNQPGVFTVSTKEAIGPFDYLVLESNDSDYVNWFVEYQNNQSWCRVNQQWQGCGSTSATVFPFVSGSVFDTYQSANGQAIDVTFTIPQAAVAVTAVDPDFAVSQMQVYDINDQLLGFVSFDVDNQTTVFNTSTKSISGVGAIRRVRLVSALNDQMAFQGLTVTT